MTSTRPPSPARLRYLALRHQGLAGKRKIGSGLAGAQKALEQIGYVQIDTISVVARAHHHTFFTRVGNYDERMPNRLVRQGKAFEHWCHAAAYLPMRDYRFALPLMRAIQRGEVNGHWRRDAKVRGWVRDRIRAEGPLFARDFDDPRKTRKGWWDWKPAKAALEQLFMEGELVSVERQGFQKRYELAERALPARRELHRAKRWGARRSRDRPWAWRHTASPPRRPSATSAGTPAYARTSASALAEQVDAGALAMRRMPNGERLFARPGAFDQPVRRLPEVVRILSPFDNAVIQRQRSVAVFDFDYTIECYTPEAKRRFGYFALPLVFRDRFVGRMDCKAHRAEGRFEIKALFLEAALEDDATPGVSVRLRSRGAGVRGVHRLRSRGSAEGGAAGPRQTSRAALRIAG